MFSKLNLQSLKLGKTHFAKWRMVLKSHFIAFFPIKLTGILNEFGKTDTKTVSQPNHMQRRILVRVLSHCGISDEVIFKWGLVFV